MSFTELLKRLYFQEERCPSLVADETAQVVWPDTALAEGEGVEPSGGDPRRSWHCSTPHDWLEVKEASSFDCTATIGSKWTQEANRYPPLRNHRKSLVRFKDFIATAIETKK